MYLSYGIPRALRNIWKNWRASFNSLVILTASLGVLGLIVLLYTNVIQLSSVWLSNTTVSLFLKPGLAPEVRQAILEEVEGHPLVKKANLISPEPGLKSRAD